jgi:hypothetical protein
MLDYGERSEEAARIADKIFHAPLTVVKRTKKGEKETDIQPMIKEVNVKYAFGCVIVDCILCADSETYLNPFYLTGALDKEMGEEAAHRKVMRTAAFLADGKVFK